MGFDFLGRIFYNVGDAIEKVLAPPNLELELGSREGI